ncbi:hypothetical protein CEXT_692471 [Caerostris extrusa]|uniref:Uncharacterized protein n=1 Tax=Caerostris extrusa TaxID=172846 RepID=A0AAV4R4Z4_CAEEX|nr:hypothetical protein CEXT_692471 [Caerostris extrusa]
MESYFGITISTHTAFSKTAYYSKNKDTITSAYIYHLCYKQLQSRGTNCEILAEVNNKLYEFVGGTIVLRRMGYSTIDFQLQTRPRLVFTTHT